MTTAYTSLLGLALPVTGELSGTWGDTVNNSITSLLDTAVAGTTTITADTTLSTTTGAANQARQAILLCSPASANITVTAPAQSKIYTVINTSATYTVTVRGVGPTTGVTIATSESAVIAWNGSDFIRISSSSTFTAPVVIEGTTTSAALRITQLGTGNALLVEDSTNPDSTPFVIDSAGNVIQGTTASATGGLSGQTYQQHVTATISSAGALFAGWNATQPNSVNIARSTSGTIGSFTTSPSGTASGIKFFFDDGTAFIRGASIDAAVDGTAGTNDMPGRLVFSTTADGGTVPTERMRIGNDGGIGIGTTNTAGYNLLSAKNLTGSTSVFGIASHGAIQSDATSSASMFRTSPTVASAVFTIPNLNHYVANQSTFGAGSTVTNHFGFIANSNLTGATNNYCFYGAIAAPTSGITTTGTITSISSSTTTVTVNHNAITYTNGQTVTISATANATALTSGATCTILTVGTTDFTLIGAASNTVGVSFTATGAGTGTGTVTLNVQGSGKTVAGAASGSFTYTTTTSQTFAAITVLTGSVTVSTRYNLYMGGNADNYLAGNVGIGTATPAVKLDVSGTMRSTSATTTGAAGGTITPTSDTTNQYTITALGAAATIAIPSGTPIDGQKLTIRIKDNGTARALTWTTTAGGYRIIGTTLPVTTVVSKTVYIGCVYNSADSFWDVVAVAQQA